MLHTVAIRGSRSLREIVLPFARLTVVAGANVPASRRFIGRCACWPTAGAAR